MVELYSRDVLDIEPKKVVKKRSRKTPPVEIETPVDEPKEIPIETKEQVEPVKPVEPKLETVEPKEPKEPEQKEPKEPKQKKPKLDDPTRKERLAKLAEARALKRQAQIDAQRALEEQVQLKTAEVEKLKRRRGAIKNEAPDWFKEYVSQVKREEAPVTAKTTKAAYSQANKAWNDGYVRDKVQNEVDGHMNRMYSMIFGARNI